MIHNSHRRWWFLLQVPISVFALVVGWLVIHSSTSPILSCQIIKSFVDIAEADSSVLAVSVQLVGLDLGGNELPWSSTWVNESLVCSSALLVGFVWVEATITTIPVIPLRQLCGQNPVAIRIVNFCAGTATYAYLFMPPLFSQVGLLNLATTAGTRLATPSLAALIGGVVTGMVMSQQGKPLSLIRVDAALMTLANGLMALFGSCDST